MKRRLLAVLLGSALAGTLAGVHPAGASTRALQVQAFVVSMQCQGGDFVSVKLSARSMGGTGTVMYRWDFTNNGSFDTRPSPNPTVTHLYGDELTITARVGARDEAGSTAMDLVTFTTPRCP